MAIATARRVPKVALVLRKRSACQTDVWYAGGMLRSALVTSCTGDEGPKAMNHAAPGLIFRVTQW